VVRSLDGVAEAVQKLDAWRAIGDMGFDAGAVLSGEFTVKILRQAGKDFEAERILAVTVGMFVVW
jgi:hypothetical protein